MNVTLDGESTDVFVTAGLLCADEHRLGEAWDELLARLAAEGLLNELPRDARPRGRRWLRRWAKHYRRHG